MAASEFGYGEGAGQGRRGYLGAALGWSLFAHALLLGWSSLTAVPERWARPLFVYFRELPSAVQPERAQQQWVDHAPFPPAPKSEAAVAHRAGKAETAARRPRSGETSGEASAARPAQVADIPPPATAVEPAETDWLRRYRLALAAAMARFHAYPEVARQRAWQGRVVLRLYWPEGGWAVVAVEISSGHLVLDQAARAMLLQAARATPVPPELEMRGVVLPLTVVFDLED